MTAFMLAPRLLLGPRTRWRVAISPDTERGPVGDKEVGKPPRLAVP
jgi:hypothetical protein